MQELADPRRWVNIDETPNCERGEKSGHKACVLVSADAMKATGKAPVRVRVLNDGNGPLTMVPALRADGVVPAVGFLTAGACLTPQAAQGEALLLPGVPADIFADGLKARIYETPCGSMNVATLELFLLDQVIPAMRKDVPTGCLVVVLDAPRCHGRTTNLRNQLKKHQVCLLLLPHNSSTLTQALDVDWFKPWRAEYQAAADALLEVSKYSEAFLNIDMRAEYN